MDTGSWMGRLADHYRKFRERVPDQTLMIVFDIDGTILDMRYPILHLLWEYDRDRGTSFFSDLTLADVREHEAELRTLLRRKSVPVEAHDDIWAFYADRFWHPETMIEAHTPFRGALEVVRWFQIQPRTVVGLNTGRSESLREPTLRTLDAIGAAYKVRFRSEHLAMNRLGFGDGLRKSKADALRRFRDQGYRVFAFVDNEPVNLAAASTVDPEGEILLLHADTIFSSERRSLPSHAVSGRRYDLTPFVDGGSLPPQIELVWDEVNDPGRLRRFIDSGVRWAKVDVRRDPATSRPVLCRDPLDPARPSADARVLSLESVLSAATGLGRSVVVELREGNGLMAETLDSLERHGFDDTGLCFSAAPEVLGEAGFRELRARRPGAVLQCPVDHLAPIVSKMPSRARSIVEELSRWGIDRFSVRWGTPGLHRIVECLSEWRHDVDVRGIDDRTSLLRAALLLPRSISASCAFAPGGSALPRNRGMPGRAA